MISLLMASILAAPNKTPIHPSADKLCCWLSEDRYSLYLWSREYEIISVKTKSGTIFYREKHNEVWDMSFYGNGINELIVEIKSGLHVDVLRAKIRLLQKHRYAVVQILEFVDGEWYQW